MAGMSSGLQKILGERFPDGASKEEIAAFLSQMASDCCFASCAVVSKVSLQCPLRRLGAILTPRASS